MFMTNVDVPYLCVLHFYQKFGFTNQMKNLRTSLKNWEKKYTFNDPVFLSIVEKITSYINNTLGKQPSGNLGQMANIFLFQVYTSIGAKHLKRMLLFHHFRGFFETHIQKNFFKAFHNCSFSLLTSPIDNALDEIIRDSSSPQFFEELLSIPQEIHLATWCLIKLRYFHVSKI